MEEGEGLQGYLASSRQYGNALLGVRHQEEEVYSLHRKTHKLSPIKKLTLQSLNAMLAHRKNASIRNNSSVTTNDARYG